MTEESAAVLRFNSLPTAQVQLCTRLAAEAFALQREELRHPRELAERLKRELDARTRAAWHVVVGERFGCAVALGAGALFELGGLSFLAWRAV